jgi:hypothetical protein
MLIGFTTEARRTRRLTEKSNQFLLLFSVSLRVLRASVVIRR